LVDIMLSWFAESNGRFDDAFKELFSRPRAEVAVGVSHLHSRLLQCQVHGDDGEALRDQVLVPSLLAAARQVPLDETQLEDVLGLLALTPDPGFDEASSELRKNWESALAAAREAHPKEYDSGFTQRRVFAQNTRKNPGSKYKSSMFCTADEVSLADEALDE
jgi:hypothetical protein